MTTIRPFSFNKPFMGSKVQEKPESTTQAKQQKSFSIRDAALPTAAAIVLNNVIPSMPPQTPVVSNNETAHDEMVQPQKELSPTSMSEVIGRSIAGPESASPLFSKIEKTDTPKPSEMPTPIESHREPVLVDKPYLDKPETKASEELQKLITQPVPTKVVDPKLSAASMTKLMNEVFTPGKDNESIEVYGGLVKEVEVAKIEKSIGEDGQSVITVRAKLDNGTRLDATVKEDGTISDPGSTESLKSEMALKSIVHSLLENIVNKHENF